MHLKQDNPLNDEMVLEIKRKAKFVSEGIGEDYKYWNKYIPIFIAAQMGMGKNTFIENVVLEYVKETGGKILIVSNRIATSRQQKERIAPLVDYEQFLERYTAKGLDTVDDFKNVSIVSYQKLATFLDDIFQHSKLNKYSVVVFDEAHFFMSDALFNSKTSQILKNPQLAFKNAIRIYMTATPDEVFPVILEKEKLLWGKTFEVLCYTSNPHGTYIRPKQIIYYNFKRDYDYIRPKYFNTKEEVLEIIKTDKSESKWLVFINSKVDGENFVEQIGSKAVLVSADSKNSKNDDGKTYDEIIREEKFTCKVLVSTSVLDNGINLKDISLKNIVIFAHDKTEFLQMLGRKRIIDDEKINLYICARDVCYFNANLRRVNSKIQAICLFKKDLSAFNEQYILGPDSNHKLVKNLLYTDKQGDFHLNELAEKKLYEDNLFLKKMLDKLKSGLKEDFIYEQLSWLGLQKTYDASSWVSYAHSDENIAKFLKFLNEHCDISLSGESRDKFEKEFKTHVNSAYGKQKNDRTERCNYKETKMRSIFKVYNLNYIIEIKNGIFTLKKY